MTSLSLSARILYDFLPLKAALSVFFSSLGEKHLYISIRDRVGREKHGCQFVLCYFFINTIPKLYDIIVQSLSRV